MSHSAAATPSETRSARQDFWLLLLLFLAFRLLTLLLFRPGGFIRDWSDFDTYLGIASLSDYGLYPFFHFWLEWPPLIPWLMVGAYKLSLLWPQWEDPRLGFITILGLIFVLFEAGNFALIYRLARRIFPEPAQVTRVLWLYAALFPPVYAMLGYFDGVALFFILLSLDLLLSNQNFRAALVAAVGFAVKLTPILAAAVAARVLWHRHREQPRRVLTAWLGYGLAFLAAAAILLAPFWLGHLPWLVASFRATLGRSSWETLWAVLEGYYSFGVVAGNRLNPAETAFAVHPASLPWGAISLAFAGLYAAVFFGLKADYAKPRPVIAFAGLTVQLFLLYSKGYSPQFLVYVLPFVILLLPNGVGVGYALALTLLNVLEQPIFFVLLPAETWLLMAVVVARFVLFVALALEFALATEFSAFGLSIPPVVNLKPWRLTLAGLFLAGSFLLFPLMGRAYYHTQLERDPHRAELAFVQTQATSSPATLVFTEQALYRRWYPYLKNDFRLKLAGGDALYPTAPVAAQILAGETRAWVLATGPQAQAVSAAAESLGTAGLTYQLEGLGNLTWYDFAGHGSAPAPVAQAANGPQLLSYRTDVVTGTVNVTLFWQTVQMIPADYTVFVQLLNSAGQRVAGHDSPPAYGTRPVSGWPAGVVIADAHRLVLPADLPAGQYRLVAGLYSADGSRLPFASAGPDNAIPLTELTLP